MNPDISIPRRSLHFFKASVAAVLCATLVLDPIAFAAPAISQNSPDIKISKKLGRVEESFLGQNGKTVIYLQDAHNSLEAQENIAKIIHALVKRSDVRTVYEEGYEGPVPTDSYFAFIENRELRKKISYFFLDKLRIGGAEYAHINREKEFRLIGADNIKLHLENIAKYRESSRLQKIIRRDLDSLHQKIRFLLDRDFTSDAKEWIRLRERFESGKLSILDYLKRIQVFNGRPAVSHQPSAISEKENSLAESRKLKADGLRKLTTLFPNISLLMEAEISKNPVALEQVKRIEAKELFREIDLMEESAADRLLRDDREREIFRHYKELHLLKRLNEIQVTPAEYENAKQTLDGLNTRDMADFIARETASPVLLSRQWEKNIESAVRFYEIAHARDEAMEKTLSEFMKNPDEKTAVLVFGGFHKEKIKAFLQASGCSYQIVTPSISGPDTVHQAYYKQLMSAGRHSFEIPAALARAARAATLFVMPAGRRQLLAVYRSALNAVNLPETVFVRQVERELSSISSQPSVKNTQARISAESRKPTADSRKTRSELRVASDDYDLSEEPLSDKTAWEILQGVEKIRRIVHERKEESSKKMAGRSVLLAGAFVAGALNIPLLLKTFVPVIGNQIPWWIASIGPIFLGNYFLSLAIKQFQVVTSLERALFAGVANAVILKMSLQEIKAWWHDPAELKRGDSFDLSESLAREVHELLAKDQDLGMVEPLLHLAVSIEKQHGERQQLRPAMEKDYPDLVKQLDAFFARSELRLPEPINPEFGLRILDSVYVWKDKVADLFPDVIKGAVIVEAGSEEYAGILEKLQAAGFREAIRQHDRGSIVIMAEKTMRGSQRLNAKRLLFLSASFYDASNSLSVENRHALIQLIQGLFSRPWTAEIVSEAGFDMDLFVDSFSAAIRWAAPLMVVAGPAGAAEFLAKGMEAYSRVAELWKERYKEISENFEDLSSREESVKNEALAQKLFEDLLREEASKNIHIHAGDIDLALNGEGAYARMIKDVLEKRMIPSSHRKTGERAKRILELVKEKLHQRSELRTPAREGFKTDVLKGKKFVIIGSGPSGIGAAIGLMKANPDVQIDFIDEMPRPFGLINYGVRDDKEAVLKEKLIAKYAKEIFGKGNVRFFGNVKVGRDLAIHDLTARYDGVIVATGAQSANHLGVTGEDITGIPVYAAKNYVFHYNGRPPQSMEQFHIGKRVLIIGVGNVAADVAHHVLQHTAAEEVILMGRRGPEHSSFSLKELKDLGSVPNLNVTIDEQDFDRDREQKYVAGLETQMGQAGLDHGKKQRLGVASARAKDNPNYLRELAGAATSAQGKKLTFKFLWAPTEFVVADGKLTGVLAARNQLIEDKLTTTDETEFLEVDTIFYAIPDRGVQIPGLPFDKARGIIPTENHQVFDPEKGVPIDKVYASGWIKTGPRGLIANAVNDGEETANSLIQNLQHNPAQVVASQDLAAFLKQHGTNAVNFQDYLNLKEVEDRIKAKKRKRFVEQALRGELGESLKTDPKLREKEAGKIFHRIPSMSKMLRVIETARLRDQRSELRGIPEKELMGYLSGVAESVLGDDPTLEISYNGEQIRRIKKSKTDHRRLIAVIAQIKEINPDRSGFYEIGTRGAKIDIRDVPAPRSELRLSADALRQEKLFGTGLASPKLSEAKSKGGRSELRSKKDESELMKTKDERIALMRQELKSVPYVSLEMVMAHEAKKLKAGELVPENVLDEARILRILKEEGYKKVRGKDEYVRQARSELRNKPEVKVLESVFDLKKRFWATALQKNDDRLLIRMNQTTWEYGGSFHQGQIDKKFPMYDILLNKDPEGYLGYLHLELNDDGLVVGGEIDDLKQRRDPENKWRPLLEAWIENLKGYPLNAKHPFLRKFPTRIRPGGDELPPSGAFPIYRPSRSELRADKQDNAKMPDFFFQDREIENWKHLSDEIVLRLGPAALQSFTAIITEAWNAPELKPRLQPFLDALAKSEHGDLRYLTDFLMRLGQDRWLDLISQSAVYSAAQMSGSILRSLTENRTESWALYPEQVQIPETSVSYELKLPGTFSAGGKYAADAERIRYFLNGFLPALESEADYEVVVNPGGLLLDEFEMKPGSFEFVPITKPLSLSTTVGLFPAIEIDRKYGKRQGVEKYRPILTLPLAFLYLKDPDEIKNLLQQLSAEAVTSVRLREIFSSWIRAAEWNGDVKKRGAIDLAHEAGVVFEILGRAADHMRLLRQQLAEKYNGVYSVLVGLESSGEKPVTMMVYGSSIFDKVPSSEKMIGASQYSPDQQVWQFTAYSRSELRNQAAEIIRKITEEGKEDNIPANQIVEVTKILHDSNPDMLFSYVDSDPSRKDEFGNLWILGKEDKWIKLPTGGNAELIEAIARRILTVFPIRVEQAGENAPETFHMVRPPMPYEGLYYAFLKIFFEREQRRPKGAPVEWRFSVEKHADGFFRVEVTPIELPPFTDEFKDPRPRDISGNLRSELRMDAATIAMAIGAAAAAGYAVYYVRSIYKRTLVPNHQEHEAAARKLLEEFKAEAAKKEKVQQIINTAQRTLQQYRRQLKAVSQDEEVTIDLSELSAFFQGRSEGVLKKQQSDLQKRLTADFERRLAKAQDKALKAAGFSFEERLKAWPKNIPRPLFWPKERPKAEEKKREPEPKKTSASKTQAPIKPAVEAEVTVIPAIPAVPEITEAQRRENFDAAARELEASYFEGGELAGQADRYLQMAPERNAKQVRDFENQFGNKIDRVIDALAVKYRLGPQERKNLEPYRIVFVEDLRTKIAEAKRAQAEARRIEKEAREAAAAAQKVIDDSKKELDALFANLRATVSSKIPGLKRGAQIEADKGVEKRVTALSQAITSAPLDKNEKDVWFQNVTAFLDESQARVDAKRSELRAFNPEEVQKEVSAFLGKLPADRLERLLLVAAEFPELEEKYRLYAYLKNYLRAANAGWSAERKLSFQIPGIIALKKVLEGVQFMRLDEGKTSLDLKEIHNSIRQMEDLGFVSPSSPQGGSRKAALKRLEDILDLYRAETLMTLSDIDEFIESHRTWFDAGARLNRLPEKLPANYESVIPAPFSGNPLVAKIFQAAHKDARARLNLNPYLNGLIYVTERLEEIRGNYPEEIQKIDEMKDLEEFQGYFKSTQSSTRITKLWAPDFNALRRLKSDTPGFEDLTKAFQPFNDFYLMVINGMRAENFPPYTQLLDFDEFLRFKGPLPAANDQKIFALRAYAMLRAIELASRSELRINHADKIADTPSVESGLKLSSDRLTAMKKSSQSELRSLSNRHRREETRQSVIFKDAVEHQEMYDWLSTELPARVGSEIVKNATLVHFDFHPDTHVGFDEPTNSPVTSGNVIAKTRQHGLVKKIWWIIPPGISDLGNYEWDLKFFNYFTRFGNALPSVETPVILSIDYDAFASKEERVVSVGGIDRRIDLFVSALKASRYSIVGIFLAQSPEYTLESAHIKKRLYQELSGLYDFQDGTSSRSELRSHIKISEYKNILNRAYELARDEDDEIRGGDFDAPSNDHGRAAQIFLDKVGELDHFEDAAVPANADIWWAIPSAGDEALDNIIFHYYRTALNLIFVTEIPDPNTAVHFEIDHIKILAKTYAGQGVYIYVPSSETSQAGIVVVDGIAEHADHAAEQIQVALPSFKILETFERTLAGGALVKKIVLSSVEKNTRSELRTNPDDLNARIAQANGIFDNKRTLVDFNDLAANFSDAQIEEIMFVAQKAGEDSKVSIYNVDSTQKLGKFLLSLRIKGLEVTSETLDQLAALDLRGFSGEVAQLSSRNSGMSADKLKRVLGEAGIQASSIYSLAYQDNQSGTLGVGLKDIEEGKLKNQLPEYMAIDSRGRIYLSDPSVAGAWQVLYESSLVFSRAA